MWNEKLEIIDNNESHSLTEMVEMQQMWKSDSRKKRKEENKRERRTGEASASKAMCSIGGNGKASECSCTALGAVDCGVLVWENSVAVTLIGLEPLCCAIAFLHIAAVYFFALARVLLLLWVVAAVVVHFHIWRDNNFIALHQVYLGLVTFHFYFLWRASVCARARENICLHS